MSLQKRFLVFGGEDFYPDGGAGDLIGAFSSFEEATAYAQARFEAEKDKPMPKIQWWHVLDIETMCCVASEPAVLGGQLEVSDKPLIEAQ